MTAVSLNSFELYFPRHAARFLGRLGAFISQKGLKKRRGKIEKTVLFPPRGYKLNPKSRLPMLNHDAVSFNSFEHYFPRHAAQFLGRLGAFIS